MRNLTILALMIASVPFAFAADTQPTDAQKLAVRDTQLRIAEQNLTNAQLQIQYQQSMQQMQTLNTNLATAMKAACPEGSILELTTLTCHSSQPLANPDHTIITNPAAKPTVKK